MHSTSLHRISAAVTAAVFIACFSFVPAALAAQGRIRGEIGSGSRAEIANSVHPHARLATDLGATAGETKLTGMSLRFAMTAAQSAALDQLLADQQNPASPRYHQWLTPAEYGAQFGMSQADIAKVTAWLGAQGFTVTGVANSGTYVTFDGTVAQAQTAFGTSIHNVRWNGETHFANVTNATVPSALSGVVDSVLGLHNFRAHPRMHAVAHPRFTSSVSGNHYVAPGDLYTIYDMQPLLTGGFTGAGIGTGANCHSTGGATCGDIAVVGQVDLTAGNADVLAFRTAAGLSTTNLPTTVHAAGVDPGSAQSCTGCYPNGGDLQESSLDVEWAGAMAPGANLLFVNAGCALPGTGCGNDAMSWAIDNNLAPIITDSYGNCEAAWGSTDLNAGNALFKQAAAQGQTIVAAAGDAGSTDCDDGSAISATEGLTVDFPASSPYVTAMGGTMFNGDAEATGSGTTWASTTYWTGTNGLDAISSARSYIPEAVWNEDSSGSTFGDGGGGVSAFFPKPAWQVETGAAGMTTTVKPDASRDVPDVALDAASVHDPMVFCYSGSCASGLRTSAGGNLTVAGGTSFDSQVFGGMLALLEQKAGSRLGMVNPTLYALGNNATYYNTGSTSVFHDVTSGNNNNPCTAGTPNCPNGGTIGYSASTGYDLATGWGSVDLNNLATSWKLVTPLGVGTTGSNVSTTTLASTPACTTSGLASYSPCTLSVATGNSVTLTATVTGSAGTPTGTVQFLDNNAALGTPVALSSGVATYTLNASCATLGQQMLSAVYSGDATYAGSKGPALPTGEATSADLSSTGSTNTNPLVITVTSNSCPDFSVAPSGNSTSTASVSVSGSGATIGVQAGGAIPPVTITATPVNGFTGTVTFTSSVVSTSGYTPAVTFNPSTLTFTGSSSASQTTTVSVSGITADLKMPARPGTNEHPWYAAGSGVAIAGLFLLMAPRRRRLGGLLLAVVAMAFAAGATGCGGSSQATVGTGNTNTNPYAGTYTVNVIATYSSSGQSTTHSSMLTYIIQ